MMFTKIEEKKPPFDRPVLVRAQFEDGFKYAIAFNQCYPPQMALTHKVETKNGTTYADVPFQPEEWLELES